MVDGDGGGADFVFWLVGNGWRETAGNSACFGGSGDFSGHFVVLSKFKFAGKPESPSEIIQILSQLRGH